MTRVATITQVQTSYSQNAPSRSWGYYPSFLSPRCWKLAPKTWLDVFWGVRPNCQCHNHNLSGDKTSLCTCFTACGLWYYHTGSLYGHHRFKTRSIHNRAVQVLLKKESNQTILFRCKCRTSHPNLFTFPPLSFDQQFLCLLQNTSKSQHCKYFEEKECNNRNCATIKTQLWTWCES